MDSFRTKNKIPVLLKGIMCAVLFLSVLAFFPACNKDNNDKAHLSVRMTDAPADYNAVMIDIQGVEVTGNDGSIILLHTNTGIYNLLAFSNGVDTLIASADLNAGTISQIRLILGSDNTVKVGNVVYHLSTPSASQSGLKLQVHQTFAAGVSYDVLLDFDANQSIVSQGNGEYQLKPVIRTIDAAISGSIQGHISPVSEGAVVTATSNGNTYTTVTNANGEFLMAGLSAGTYIVVVTPDLPLLPFTITGTVVSIGETTSLGSIVL
jgi:hypothetical protein